MPRGMTSGATTNWNAQRFASAHAPASASKSALSRIGMPMYGSRMWCTWSGHRQAARVGDALVGARRVLHVPHQHRRLGVVEELHARRVHAGLAAEGRSLADRLVERPVAAADEHRVARLRGHALRVGGVGQLPAVHRCARRDELGAAQARDVVEHAAGRRCPRARSRWCPGGSSGMPYSSRCWPFQVSLPSATGRWHSASRCVSVNPWMNSERWSHIAPESCIATMCRAGYGLAGPGLVSIDRAHEITRPSCTSAAAARRTSSESRS